MDITYLPPCPTEDSTDCYWDATVHGNGTGQSFATYHGETILFDVPENHYTLDVAVNPASPTGFSTVFQEYPVETVQFDPAFIFAIVGVAIVASIVSIVVGYLRRG